MFSAMGSRREVQITIPVERFQDLVSVPFTWGDLARMAGMRVNVGWGEYFWRVQMLEVDDISCSRAQVVVRSAPHTFSLQVDKLQTLLPAYRDCPNVGEPCNEETDQHSPRQDPRYTFFGMLGEWHWIRQVHYTYRYSRWEKRWRFLLCLPSDAYGRPHPKLSVEQTLLSEWFRNILPFIVKMHYDCVSHGIMQEINQEDAAR